MALLFMDGFDAGDFAQKWSSHLNGMVSSTTTTPYGSGRSIRTNGTGGQVNKVAKVITPSVKIFVGFNYNTEFVGTSFFISSADGGAVQHIVLSTAATGAIQIQRGSTIIASSAAAVVSANTWNYIEVSGTVHDTTGNVEVKVNGAVVASFAGDTRNGGTSSNIDMVGLASHSLTATSFFDNFYVCNDTGAAPYNTYLGDIRINTIVPDGPGSDANFTPSTGANHQTVDELPFSNTDYNSASASGTRDLYSMGNLSGNYSVLALQNNVIAKKIDAGGTALKPAIKSGGAIYYGAPQTVTPTDSTVTDLRTVDPSTSATWTIGGVNSIEVGMEIV